MRFYIIRGVNVLKSAQARRRFTGFRVESGDNGGSFHRGYIKCVTLSLGRVVF